MMMAARENSPVLNVPYLVVSIPIGMERNMPDITNMDISMPDSVLLAIARSETMFVNTGATLLISALRQESYLVTAYVNQLHLYP